MKYCKSTTNSLYFPGQCVPVTNIGVCQLHICQLEESHVTRSATQHHSSTTVYPWSHERKILNAFFYSSKTPCSMTHHNGDSGPWITEKVSKRVKEEVDKILLSVVVHSVRRSFWLDTCNDETLRTVSESADVTVKWQLAKLFSLVIRLLQQNVMTQSGSSFRESCLVHRQILQLEID